MVKVDNYGGILAAIGGLQHIKGADNIQTGFCMGYPVVVGKEVKEGDLGLLIREGSQLSPQFCAANGLYAVHCEETGKKIGNGYLPANGRVRAITLRGARSEAIFIPWDSDPFGFLFEAGEGQTYEKGTPFDQVRDHTYVKKYVTPATVRAQRQGKQKAPKFSRYKDFAKHYDTAQLRQTAFATPPGTLIWTEKVHGTSGRTTRGDFPLPQSWAARAWNKVMGWALPIKPKMREEIVSGTRNCILDNKATGEKAKGYRFRCHEYLAQYIMKGESIYYEIVGYEDTGRPIMPPHNLDCTDLPSKLRKKLKRANTSPDSSTLETQMHYSYGCDPNGPMLTESAKLSGDWNHPRFRIMIYRIVQDGTELTWDEVVLRVKDFEIPGVVECVPFLGSDKYPGQDGEWIIEKANELTRGRSTLDERHIREGVCMRAESLVEGVYHVQHARKHKGFVFSVPEGFGILNDNEVDPEAIA